MKDELREAALEKAMQWAFMSDTESRTNAEYVTEIFDAGYEARAAEVKAVMDRLAEAEYVIGGMHHLGTSTAAVNAATALNQYLEKYSMKKPLSESYTEGE